MSEQMIYILTAKTDDGVILDMAFTNESAAQARYKHLKDLEEGYRFTVHMSQRPLYDEYPLVEPGMPVVWDDELV